LKFNLKNLKSEIDKSLEFHGVSAVVRGIIRQLIEGHFEKELREKAEYYRDKNTSWADNIWVVLREILGE